MPTQSLPSISEKFNVNLCTYPDTSFSPKMKQTTNTYAGHTAMKSRLKLYLLSSFLLLSPVGWAGDASAAVAALLVEAKNHFSQGKNEQAAALLERALRIQPGNPILWHNLAGVRLQQEEWAKSASLAAKANSLAVDNRWLRIRNWTVIALACDGMGDVNCMREARSRAQALAVTE